MARKKKTIEIEKCEGCEVGCEDCTKPCELCSVSGECICQPIEEIASEASDIPVEAIPDHICASESCCLPAAPEASLEPSDAPLVEQPIQDPKPAGQGHWDQKYNMARRSKSPAARKYIPVHRQR